MNLEAKIKENAPKLCPEYKRRRSERSAKNFHRSEKKTHRLCLGWQQNCHSEPSEASPEP